MNKFKSTEKLLIDGKNATAVGSTSSEAKTRNVDLLNAREVDSAIKGIRIESIGEQSGQVMYGSYGRVRVLLESGDEFFISIIMSQLSSVLGSPTMNIFNEKGIDWIKPDFAKYVQVNSSGEILFHEKDFNS